MEATGGCAILNTFPVFLTCKIQNTSHGFLDTLICAGGSSQILGSPLFGQEGVRLWLLPENFFFLLQSFSFAFSFN